MREYTKTKEISALRCNKCGKELKVENGVIKEGCFSANPSFGYFSKKDGERHEFDLCETCYDEAIAAFVIPVTKTEETELC